MNLSSISIRVIIAILETNENYHDSKQSLFIVRVKFEPESSSSHESSSSQVPFLLFSFPFCFDFVFIKGCDCDFCFHNDVPTDVRSIKHERDIIVNAIARIHCW